MGIIKRHNTEVMWERISVSKDEMPKEKIPLVTRDLPQAMIESIAVSVICIGFASLL